MHRYHPISLQTSVAQLLPCSIKTQTNDQLSIKFCKHQRLTNVLPDSCRPRRSRRNSHTLCCITKTSSMNSEEFKLIKRLKLVQLKKPRNRPRRCRNSRKDLLRCKFSNSSSILHKATWKCTKIPVFSMNSIPNMYNISLHKRKTLSQLRQLHSTNHQDQFQALKLRIATTKSIYRLRLLPAVEATIMKRISSSLGSTKLI